MLIKDGNSSIDDVDVYGDMDRLKAHKQHHKNKIRLAKQTVSMTEYTPRDNSSSHERK